MFSASNSNNRASLLSGLRTGGVPPKTAAPNAAGFQQQMQLPPQQFQNRAPMTAAVDGPNNSFASQQQQFNAFQLQAMQLEMLKIQALQAQQYQAELIRQQQTQQQQQQPQQAQQQRRLNIQPPASAGPGANFDLRSATLSAQMRRSQAEQLKAQQASVYDQAPMTAGLGGKFGTRSASSPMGMASAGLRQDNGPVPPTPQSSTTVISGGTSLGNPNSNNVNPPATPSKSDAVSSWRRGSPNNSALNAIRDRAASSPAVRSTPSPMKERTSPAPGPVSATTPVPTTVKRPKPLSFSFTAQQPMIPAVLIETSEGDEDADDNSSISGTSNSLSDGTGSHKSSPTTSNELLSDGGINVPLSAREEASKKLYEGLGIGRPRSRNQDSVDATQARAPSVNMEPPRTAALFPSHAHQFSASSFPHSPLPMAPMPHTASLSGPNYAQHRLDRTVTQPKRQPRGPPSGADELGPMNFATRSPRLSSNLVGSMQNLAVEAY